MKPTAASLLLAMALSGAAAADPLPPPEQIVSREPLNETPRDALARAQQMYSRNDYRAAIDSLRLLIDQHQLGSDDEIEALRLLACSEAQTGEMGEAESHLRKIVGLRTDFALNENQDPVAAVELLKKIRRDDAEIILRYRQQEAADKEKRRKAEDEQYRKSIKPVIIERTVEKHSLLLAIAPLGAGQFQNGESGKGTAFLVTELALGLASVGLFTAVNVGYAGRQLDTTSAALANQLSIAQQITGWLCIIDVAIGVIDSVRHFQPQVVTEKKLSSATLAPFVSSSGGGLSFQGAF